MLGFVEVFELFLHDHIEEVTALHGDDAHRGPPPNRLKRRMQLFIAGRRIAPPRLEERRADRWECVDSPFRENAADQPHAVLAFDPEIIVHRIDRLVPEKLAVNGWNEEGILYRSRSRKTSAALKQTCATGKKKRN